MKLRLRKSKRTVITNISDENATLEFLKKEARRLLNLESDFYLSLNGDEPLEDDDRQLSALGLVSGDLVLVLTDQPEVEASPEQDNATSRVEPMKTDSSSAVSTEDEPCTTSDQAGHVTVEQCPDEASTSHDPSQPVQQTADEPSTSQDTSHDTSHDLPGEAAAEEEAVRDAEVNRYLNEPMLIRDSTETSVPSDMKKLYGAATPMQNSYEALVLVLHVLMKESGFSLQGAAAAAEERPVSWRSPGGYKMNYSHPDNPAITFTLICIELGPLLMVHGLAEGGDTLYASQEYKLKCSMYVCGLNLVVEDTYKNLSKLSRTFKDSVSYPMLQNLSAGGPAPVPTLLNLVYEVKLQMLQCLDCASLLRLSQVCSDLQNLSREKVLWRRLYLKDFGRRTNNELNQDWLNLYKEKHALRQRAREQFQRMTMVVPPFMDRDPFFPSAPMYPPGFIGGDYDLNPNFQGIPGAFHPTGPGMFARPRFDPIGPLPDQRFRPGRGGGMRDSGRPGRGRWSGFGPRFF